MTIQEATFKEVNDELAAMNLGLPVLTPENYHDILKNMPELASVNAQLDQAVQFTQGLKSYTDGVMEISLGAAKLAQGAGELNHSTSEIAKLAHDLYQAGAKLNAAIKELCQGMVAYKEGTEKLRNNTAKIDAEISNRINDMMGNVAGDGGKTVSFVSSKNINVSFVQFVIKTNEIRLPAVDEPQKKPVKIGFWQRLLKLFELGE